MEHENKSITIDPIGWITSPFKEKFGAPRQPREVEAAEGFLHFYPLFRSAEALREIDCFDHLWIIFQFHLNPTNKWSPLVRPPRLGGNKKVGVFASRSSFRPNGLGMSAVKNLGVVQDKAHGTSVRLGGLDIVDGTPVFDLKPYLPYSDSIPEASVGFSTAILTPLTIQWFCDYHGDQKVLIEQTLQLDPRPGYKGASGSFGCTIGDENILWEYVNGEARITAVNKLK